MKYEILQLKPELLEKYGFMDYDFAKKHGFKIDDYVKVYEGDMEAKDVPTMLEQLFYIFNCKRPEDFKGHSMSVSDIVRVDEVVEYYCDSFGFTRID